MRAWVVHKPGPVAVGDAELAPLLCAGIISYRALKRAGQAVAGLAGERFTGAAVISM